MSTETRIVCDECKREITGTHSTVEVSVSAATNQTKLFDTHPGACLDRLLAREEVQLCPAYTVQTVRMAA